MDFDSLPQNISAIVVALVGLSFGVQQLVKRWNTTSAENSVLTLLHTELERMAVQNKLLSSYVNALQHEAIKINSELGKLQIENQKLHAEVICLTQEIISLQKALNKDGKNETDPKP
jgi:uncharacterized protein YlxW (UPF0749 family)